jgi:hypothetical protein
MTIAQLILDRAEQLREPLGSVAFSYDQGVDDPLEIQAVIEKMGNRAMPWADALPALLSLGSKRAPIIRVDTTEHTLLVGNAGNCWRILDEKRRPGRR